MALLTITSQASSVPVVTPGVLILGETASTVTFQVVASENPTSYLLVNTTGKDIIIHPTTGLITMNRTTDAAFTGFVTVYATNNYGTGSGSISIQQAAKLYYYSVSVFATASKNDCEEGFVASGIETYVLPVGTIVSSISQLDADTIAQAQVDANVQAYANLVGTCIAEFGETIRVTVPILEQGQNVYLTYTDYFGVRDTVELMSDTINEVCMQIGTVPVITGSLLLTIEELGINCQGGME